jgi:hypothetical protein
VAANARRRASGAPHGNVGSGTEYVELAEAPNRHARLLLVVAAAAVVGCAIATWWQVQRSLDGNVLSHFYQFLWPLYAGYIVYLWRRLRRGANSLIGREEGPAPDPVRDDDDEEVRAHNRYLAGKKADAQRRGH